MTAPYYSEYPGYWPMVFHDDHSELHRWFDNWKVEKYAYFHSHHEWITIDERHWTHRGKTITQYTGTIGADHHDKRRTVLFEPGAPPPPTFFVPVKTKYEPPPPEPAHVTMRRHMDFMRAEQQCYQMLWGRFTPEQRFVARVLPPIDPPPPRYRRNA